MSIRIVPESERSPKLGDIAEIKLPEPALPYAQRAARLRHLAQGHAMEDYLLWAADVCEAQEAAAQANAFPDAEGQHLAQVMGNAYAPLDSAHWERSDYWLVLLDAFLAHLKGQSHTPAIAQAIEQLQNSSTEQRQAWADALLAELRGDELPADAQLPEPAAAQLLWSALSVYWRQLASHLPVEGVAEGHERHSCPICRHAPVGSLIMGGAQSGVRYVQCSLCESLWHIVRVMCTQCGEGGKLEHWALEDEKAPIKAEACGACGSYLKNFSVPTDTLIELIADDLASLALDAEMDDKGIARSGINPLMLPDLA